MKIIQKIVVTCILYLVVSNCIAWENAFYILRSKTPWQNGDTKDQFASLTQHYQSIDILISQAYEVGPRGMVWGFVDSDVLNFAKQHSLKLMVMVTNHRFDKEEVHQFLSDLNAQKKASELLVDVCKRYHYYGVQFDFEMVPLADKDALTRFYQNAAEMLHANGFKVSFAVAPVTGDGVFESDFQKKLYENWEGAYDLKNLAKSGDFFTMMAYNQHGGSTTPGPTASIPWVEKVITHALQYLPAEKISLGVPLYSTYWFTGYNPDAIGKKFDSQEVGISFQKANYLINKYHATLQWNDKDKLNFTFYDRDWLYEYIFVEDAKSLKEKLELAKKYHLRGISAFYIGIEDPQIWELLSGVKS